MFVGLALARRLEMAHAWRGAKYARAQLVFDQVLEETHLPITRPTQATGLLTLVELDDEVSERLGVAGRR